MAKKKPVAVESYIAHAKVTARAAVTSLYKIEVRFLGGLNTAQKNAFKKAADRWTKVIVGDLPSVLVDGEVIDDLLILAQGVAIDGVGGILGQAGPTQIRSSTAGAAAFLPVKGIMSFDTADLANMQANGTLTDVITHEMGHVIGIGTVWTRKRLLAGAGTSKPTFTGTKAKKEFGVLKGTGPQAVPVENRFGPGTRDAHWHEQVFGNELMSGFVASAGNPLSRMTAASLSDMGYVVDMTATEPYSLPRLLAGARTAGVKKLAAAAAVVHPHTIPIIPIECPASAMR